MAAYFSRPTHPGGYDIKWKVIVAYDDP